MRGISVELRELFSIAFWLSDLLLSTVNCQLSTVNCQLSTTGSWNSFKQRNLGTDQRQQLRVLATMAWEEPRKTGMQYRRLGNSGLHVSALGLGGWLTTGGMSIANALRTSAQVQD
jgi:hypothetical protein